MSAAAAAASRSNKRRRSSRRDKSELEGIGIIAQEVIVESSSSTTVGTTVHESNSEPPSLSSPPASQSTVVSVSVSPVHTYYNGLSLDDDSSLAGDPFCVVSDLLLKLEGLVEKRQRPQHCHSNNDATKELLGLFKAIGSSSGRRDDYRNAVLELQGIRILVRILNDATTTGIEESLILSILENLCLEVTTASTTASSTSAVSTTTATMSSSSNCGELLARDIAEEGFEWLLQRIRDHEKEPSNVCLAWNLLCNATYFGSFGEEIGKERMRLLADIAIWAMESWNTNRRIQQQQQQQHAPSKLAESHKIAPTRKRGRSSMSNDQESPSSSTTTTTTPVEAILGTIRNLVADPTTSREDWEQRNLVSKLLDIFSDDEEEKPDTPVTPTTFTTTTTTQQENDFLHFLMHASNDDSSNETPAASPNTMEHNEETIWNLLGIFQVCATKQILCSSTLSLFDIERLSRWMARCLRVFANNNNRRVLQRLVRLLDGLLSPPQSNDGDHWLQSPVFCQKLLISEGCLTELLALQSSSSSSLSSASELSEQLISVIAKLQPATSSSSSSSSS